MSANYYWRSYAYQNPKTGKWGVKVTVSEEAEAYKRQVRGAVEAKGYPCLSGETALKITIYRLPKRRGDLGNCLKVMEDALNRVIVVDDSQTTKLQMEFIYCKELDTGEMEEERAEVLVETRDRERERTKRQKAVLEKYRHEWDLE